MADPALTETATLSHLRFSWVFEKRFGTGSSSGEVRLDTDPRHSWDLEDEMCTWVPGVSKWSPNRLDAMVWLFTELMLEGGGTWGDVN